MGACSSLSWDFNTRTVDLLASSAQRIRVFRNKTSLARVSTTSEFWPFVVCMFLSAIYGVYCCY